ncbi:MAG: hypothetical protein PWP39_1016 [Pyrococcus sp.]|uniref:hypothetical protein n=1 Tax=Pyrococcus sp. TaxID=33866 RepID=UPI00258F0701|nr:hypothetical protein [Pyrococcus sp.]MDK2869781.1 hypothetical protein [Pyrococcus sp.]
MPRLVIPILALLIFSAPMASAVYSVKQGGFLYEVWYHIYSNGTSALIHIGVENYNIACGMTSCWAEVYDAYEYLLYYDGSNLYLLNFTPALREMLPKNMTNMTIYPHSFMNIFYLNGSWYVNLTSRAYPEGSFKSIDLNPVYRLSEDFCVELVNVTVTTKTENKTINGWEIVIPEEFREDPVFADFFIAENASVYNWSEVRRWIDIEKWHHFVPNSSNFPVYFLLKKGDQVRRVTLLYINTTDGLNGFWFPEDVKIVNVTLCKPTPTIINETTTSSTPRRKHKICGPGVVMLLFLIPPLIFSKIGRK